MRGRLLVLTAPVLESGVKLPLHTCPAEAAVKCFGVNPHARWYKNGIDVHDATGDFAVQRLAAPIFSPSVPQSDLRIGADDKLFAIGSCFARGIELAMVHRGFDVPSFSDEFDAFELVNDQVTGRGFTNKYTTFAIENEIRWAIDPTVAFPFGSLVDQPDGTVIDPHTTPTLKWVDREATLGRRRVISEVYSRLKQSRVVVMTLGLVETWFDEQAGCYLNMTPNAEMRELHPGRYRFEVTSFDQNAAAIERTVSALEKYGHPEVQVVVTVSPVPLMATFSNRDVVIANAYSKSLLRTVAEEASVAHENVHYFPSYEIVTQSARDIAWAEDGRHVQGHLVSDIMKLFVSSFVEAAD